LAAWPALGPEADRQFSDSEFVMSAICTGFGVTNAFDPVLAIRDAFGDTLKQTLVRPHALAELWAFTDGLVTPADALQEDGLRHPIHLASMLFEQASRHDSSKGPCELPLEEAPLLHLYDQPKRRYEAAHSPVEQSARLVTPPSPTGPGKLRIGRSWLLRAGE